MFFVLRECIFIDRSMIGAYWHHEKCRKIARKRKTIEEIEAGGGKCKWSSVGYVWIDDLECRVDGTHLQVSGIWSWVKRSFPTAASTWILRAKLCDYLETTDFTSNWHERNVFWVLSQMDEKFRLCLLLKHSFQSEYWKEPRSIEESCHQRTTWIPSALHSYLPNFTNVLEVLRDDRRKNAILSCKKLKVKGKYYSTTMAQRQLIKIKFPGDPMKIPSKLRSKLPLLCSQFPLHIYSRISTCSSSSEKFFETLRTVHFLRFYKSNIHN